MASALPPSKPRSELAVRVIVPHAGLDGFRFAWQSLWSAFPQARGLAWRFFLRDTRAAHRQSVLGYLWILLPPLVNTLVWVLLNKSDVVRIASGAVPYPVFVLAGTVLWAAFNAAIMATLSVVGDARGMLAKVNFPHEALVYSAFLKSLVEAVIPALLLVPAVWLYRVPLQAGALLFPVALGASLALGLALGLALVPLAALYSDVSRAVQLALRFGFFVTPVIFPLPASGLARSLMSLNPLTSIIVSGRGWLAGSGEVMPGAMVVVFACALALAAVALLFFKVALPHLIERLSA
jgi:lipopolysaccharide transport system permease protein